MKNNRLRNAERASDIIYKELAVYERIVSQLEVTALIQNRFPLFAATTRDQVFQSLVTRGLLERDPTGLYLNMARFGTYSIEGVTWTVLT